MYNVCGCTVRERGRERESERERENVVLGCVITWEAILGWKVRREESLYGKREREFMMRERNGFKRAEETIQGDCLQ